MAKDGGVVILLLGVGALLLLGKSNPAAASQQPASGMPTGQTPNGGFYTGLGNTLGSQLAQLFTGGSGTGGGGAFGSELGVPSSGYGAGATPGGGFYTGLAPSGYGGTPASGYMIPTNLTQAPNYTPASYTWETNPPTAGSTLAAANTQASGYVSSLQNVTL